MFPIRVKTVQESDLRMLGSLARNIQRVLPVTQADIDAAAALGKGWVVWKVFEVSDPLDNLRGGTQLIIRQNSIQPGQNVRRVIFVAGPGGQTVVIRGTDYIVLPDAVANSLRYVKAFGGTEQNGTPTPTNPVDIVSNNGVLKVSPNLFDESAHTWTVGLLNPDTGAINTANTNYVTSEAFAIKPGTYTCSFTKTAQIGVTTGNIWAFYDASGTYIGYSGNTAGYKSGTDFNYPVVVPDNAATVRYSYRITDTNIQLERGSTATPYMPYGQIYTDGTVETINVHGKNWFNPATTTDGFIDASGNVQSSSVLEYSALIPVAVGKTYTWSGNNNRATATNKRLHSYDSNGNWVAQLQTISATNETYSVTATIPSGVAFVRLSGIRTDAPDTDVQLELGSTATEYQPYYDGGTATAEMLLKLGDYQDEQEILSGNITRNVGIKVLDGTENFETATATNCYSLTNTLGTGNFADRTIVCSHFANTPTMPGTGDRQGLAFIVNKGPEYTIAFGATTQFSTQTLWKQWLADQYAAGTPVIVIYPLATSTMELVTGQHLQVTDGDNTLEITQASLSGLELEAQYSAAVTLTVQEVEDANLDNNVEVTIS